MDCSSSSAAARRFGSESFTVGLVARRERMLRKYQDELAGAGVHSLYRVADCARETELGAALQDMQAEAGMPQALLYNAANIKRKDLLDETAAGLTADFEVNVAGALAVDRQGRLAQSRPRPRQIAARNGDKGALPRHPGPGYC